MVFECSNIFYTCDVCSRLMDVFSNQIPRLTNLSYSWKSEVKPEHRSNKNLLTYFERARAGDSKDTFAVKIGKS